MIRRTFALLLLVVLVAIVIVGAAEVQRHNSPWLSVYMLLFIGYPLARSVLRLPRGSRYARSFVQAAFWITSSLLVTAVIREFFEQDWPTACLVGLVVPGIIYLVRHWPTFIARGQLSAAQNSMKERKYREALAQAQAAHAVLVRRHDLEGRALAEWMIFLALLATGDSGRAGRFGQSARTLYRALGNRDMIRLIETEAAKAGSSLPVDKAVFEEERYIPWNYLLDAFLSVGFGLALIWLERPDPVLLAVAGGAALVLLIGLFGSAHIVSKLERPAGARRAALFALSVVLFGLVVFGIAVQQSWIPPGWLGADVRAGISPLISVMNTAPEWAPMGVLGVLTVLAAFALRGARGTSGRGGRLTRDLSAARAYLSAHDWSAALGKLVPIDLLRVRDTSDTKFILFALSLCHFMLDHATEADAALRELIRVDANYAPGLYLAGYIALKESKLDAAEKYLRALHSISPQFTVPGGKTGRYYLALVLYRRAMQGIGSDLDKSMSLLSEVSALGALDREVSDALIRVHLFRATALLRQHDWAKASAEVNLAQNKLDHLAGLVKDPVEVAKLKGLCHAAVGLVAYKQGQFGNALDSLKRAQDETRSLEPDTPDMFGGDLRSFLEQALRKMSAKGDSDRKISPNFTRDVHFLASLAHLRKLQSAGSTKQSDWNSAMAQVEVQLERAVSASPGFGEAIALLGLLYYYLSPDPKKRTTGLEMLQQVQAHVGSKFIADTVAKHTASKKQKDDARQAYFDALQQYWHAADLPLEAREEMRTRVLEEMQANGQYDEFARHGSAEIERGKEHESTVQEYVQRTALLREKLRQLIESGETGEMGDDLRRQIDQLNTLNKQLEDTVKAIAKTERDLLIQARSVM